MNILVTGGTGYIGSHTIIELYKHRFENIFILDDLSNSSKKVIQRINKISGKTPHFFQIDLTDIDNLRDIFDNYSFDAVLHFAAKKAVAESSLFPLDYYNNNLLSTMNLLKMMDEFDVNYLIHSSSATIYGDSNEYPYQETTIPGNPLSPYGASKYFCEKIINDFVNASKKIKCISLRYFNPIGAHESGLIGEDPKGVPNNLIPYITQVAVGKREKLSIFGNDYKTPDGTCRRDYIHIKDIALGHCSALSRVTNDMHTDNFEVFNLGTGQPYSVLEIVNKFIEITNIRIEYDFESRREGDMPEFWANVNKASTLLGWKANHRLADMLQDAWNWQKNNPNGY